MFCSLAVFGCFQVGIAEVVQRDSDLGHVLEVLFDLEASGFRHALLDGAFARLRYLHSLWARTLDLGLQRELQQAYRDALAGGCPEAQDDARWETALICCSAAWLAGVGRLLPGVIERDRRWGVSGNRQRVVAALEHFAVLADELRRFPAMRTTAAKLARRLRMRWPAAEQTLEPYPAFAR